MVRLQSGNGWGQKTMMKRIRTGVLALAALAAVPAAAQDDWDLGRDPGRKLTIAAVTYDNFGVAVRCMDDVMSVVVSGLPPGPGIRTLRYRIADQAEKSGRWISSGEGVSAFSVWPAAMAADLAGGGRWVLDVPVTGRTQRISVDIPASPVAIGEVFRACGRELSPASRDDEPDQEDFGGLRWVEAPIAEFPTRTTAAGGLAAVTCTVTDRGHLRACRIESEFPDGAGFGRASVVAAHRRGRVGPGPGVATDMEGRRISYMTRFNLIDDAPLQTVPSRIPLRPEQVTRPPGAD